MSLNFSALVQTPSAAEMRDVCIQNALADAKVFWDVLEAAVARDSNRPFDAAMRHVAAKRKAIARGSKNPDFDALLEITRKR